MSENLNNPVESQNERSFTGWQLYSERNSEIIVAENVKDSFLNSSERVDKEGDNYPLVVLCVDERASLGNELNTEENKYALINVPGAGLEFLSDEDILNLLKISNGDINILAHKLCGWGTLVMDDILLNDNEPLDEQAGAGLARVSNAIGIAFRDESFRNMYSVHFSLDFVEYLPEIAESFLSERLKSLQNTEYKTIDDFSDYKDQEDFLVHAFTYGKALKLRERILDVYQRNYEELKAAGLASPPNVQVLPDMLDKQPHEHKAKDAVIILTANRKIINQRFQIDGMDPFFADVNPDNVEVVLNLIHKIMEGHHSESRGLEHNYYVIVDNMEILDLIEQIQNRFLENGAENFRIVPIYVDPEL